MWICALPSVLVQGNDRTVPDVRSAASKDAALLLCTLNLDQTFAPLIKSSRSVKNQLVTNFFEHRTLFLIRLIFSYSLNYMRISSGTTNTKPISVPL